MYDSGTLTSSAPAGSKRGFWLNFTLTTALSGGQKITIQGPAGATFPTLPLNNYSIYILGGGAYLPASTTAITNGIQLTLGAGNSIAAGQTITITMPFDKSNFIGVGTPAGSATWSASTTTDSTPASTPAYTITPGPVDHLGVPGGGAVSAPVGTSFPDGGQVISALDAYNNPIPGQVVTLTTPASGPSGTFAGNNHTTSVTMGSAGQALIPTTTANTVAGSWSITESAPGATSNTIPRVNTPGAPSTVSLALDPTSIVANGTSHSTATATVTDSFGNKVSGQTVTMTATGPTVGATTNVGDGTYTAQLTSSTTSGTFSVTATDRTPNPDIVSSPVTLTQTAGPATQITVPGGISTTVNTAFASQSIAVKDANNNPVPSKSVSLTTPASGASGTFAGNSHTTTVTTNASGVASIPTTTANTISGPWQMTASTSGGPSNTLSRTNDPGAPSSVSLSLDSASLPSDGTSQTIATALVLDSFSNSVAGENVTFAASGGQATGAVTDHDDGSYTATVTSTTTPGEYTITATDSTPATPVSSGPSELRQTVLPAAGIRIELDPASVSADGISKSTATVAVTDSLGNPVSGEDVTVTSDGDQQIGTVTEIGDGTYTAPVTASKVVGQSTLTATDSTPATPVSGTAVLTQTSLVPPPPPPPLTPVVIVKPKLRFVHPPKKTVRKAKIKVRFKVVKGEARGFQCRLDRKKWTKCKSPRKVKLNRGKHVLQVRGIATDGTFGKPIKRRIKRIG